MKNIIIVILTIIFSACDIYIDDYFKQVQIGKGIEIYYNNDFIGVFNQLETHRLIIENIRPAYEGIKDEWSSPENIWERGYGDCDDYAIIFANIMYVNTGIKCNIIATSTHSYNAQVVNGGYPTHIIIEINGRTYDPYYGKYVNCDIQYRYTFDEVFNY